MKKGKRGNSGTEKGKINSFEGKKQGQRGTEVAID